MTRLVTCGWETGDVNESGGVTGSTAIANTSPTPRLPGLYYLRCGSGGVTGYRSWTFAAPKTEIWMRFAAFLNVSGSNEMSVAWFNDSANGGQGIVTWSMADFYVRVYRGTSIGSNLLGTSGQPIQTTAWHTFEIRWQIASATTGIVEVWIDGSRFINLTGVDNTNTANLNIQSAQVGFSFTPPGSPNICIDDLAINDTLGTINNGQIGDGRVVLLRPNGPGSNTNQVRGGTDSGANWSQVDDIPMSFSDYVYSATVGARDTYALQDIPSQVIGWAINAVEFVGYGQNSDSLPGSLAPTVVSGAAFESAAVPMTTSPTYFRQQYETDPNTGAAWTAAALNALEAATTVR